MTDGVDAPSLRDDLIDRFDREIRALDQKMETQFSAIGEATKVLSDNVNRVPTQLQQAVSNLQAENKRLQELFDEKVKSTHQLFNEKLNAISVRLDGIKELGAELRKTADTAINAAFLAADKVGSAQFNSFLQQINKSEQAFTKEIDGLKVNISTRTGALEGQIADLKVWRAANEGNVTGARQTTHDRQANTSMTVGQLGVAGAFVAILLTVFGMFMMNQHTASQPIPGPSGSQTTTIPSHQ